MLHRTGHGLHIELIKFNKRNCIVFFRDYRQQLIVLLLNLIFHEIYTTHRSQHTFLSKAYEVQNPKKILRLLYCRFCSINTQLRAKQQKDDLFQCKPLRRTRAPALHTENTDKTPGFLKNRDGIHHQKVCVRVCTYHLRSQRRSAFYGVRERNLVGQEHWRSRPAPWC